MSARHSTWLTSDTSEESLLAENAQLKQLNQEMKQNLDGLEQGVEEAKILVRQTQSRVEKLAASIEEIEKPDKDN